MAYSFAEVEKLMNYGFTAEQIMELHGQSEPDQPEPAPDDPPEPDRAEPAPDDPPEPDQPEPVDGLSAIRQELADLKATIQQNNIITKGVETIPAGDEKTVEQALAEIIRPAYDNKNKWEDKNK